MANLTTTPNIDHPDEVYQWLLDAHEGLDEAESLRLQARLILLLANHIGDQQVIREAIRLACGGKASSQKEKTNVA